MSTCSLLDSLKNYSKVWTQGLVLYPSFNPEWEKLTQERLITFLNSRSDAFERSCLPGHITGSALLVNPSLDKVLLTLHAKLGKWLQLGGHADGEEDVAKVALKEAREESGRPEVEFYPWEQLGGFLIDTPSAFDCDIHEIPAYRDQPQHLHYDIRYLCVLDDHLALKITSESKDLKWLTLTEASTLTGEASMLRQFEKLMAIKCYLGL